MNRKTFTLLLDNDAVKVFIKIIDFYKLASGFLNYGEDIEIFQKIKEKVLECYSTKKVHQEITLTLTPYEIGVLLSAVEFLNLVGAYLGSNIDTCECQIIRDEIVESLLQT